MKDNTELYYVHRQNYSKISEIEHHFIEYDLFDKYT